MKLEICVDSYESLVRAIKCGADRIELCSALSLGGMSPSFGLLSLAGKILREAEGRSTGGVKKCEIFVMIRPRAGDFCYSEHEFSVMLEEVGLAKKLGFDGIVTGILHTDGAVDSERMAEIVSAAKPMAVTFHRAFDNGGDPRRMVETLIDLGVDRLLTSGQRHTALEGAALIRALNSNYGDRIVIMPGSGITDTNLPEVIRLTGCTEYHMSAKKLSAPRYAGGKISEELPIPNEPVWENDGEQIRRAAEILHGADWKNLTRRGVHAAAQTENRIYRPAYDPDFFPMNCFLAEYRKTLSQVCEESRDTLRFAVKRNSAVIKYFQYEILKTSDDAEEIGGRIEAEGQANITDRAYTLKYIDRIVKTALWIVGGDELAISAPGYVFDYLSGQYGAHGERSFDRGIFEEIFKKPFAVSRLESGVCAESAECERCLIGIDLGGSTINVSAFFGDKKVYGGKQRWKPKINPDPEYHFEQICDAVNQARAALPRLDFIGISCAGISVDGSLRSSALFREVPAEKLGEALAVFDRVSAEFGGVSYALANDGEVSALAAWGGAAVLGLTLGTSLGCGYVDGRGAMSGFINELSFVPFDVSASAVVDEWSGDVGVGVSYLSQDAAIKLAQNAGLLAAGSDGRAGKDDSISSAAENFARIVELFEKGDGAARQVFADIGIYLGYSIPFFCEFFEFECLSLQGGVVAGAHGGVIVESAKAVLASEFPELFSKIRFLGGAEIRSQADTAAFL